VIYSLLITSTIETNFGNASTDFCAPLFVGFEEVVAEGSGAGKGAAARVWVEVEGRGDEEFEGKT